MLGPFSLQKFKKILFSAPTLRASQRSAYTTNISLSAPYSIPSKSPSISPPSIPRSQRMSRGRKAFSEISIPDDDTPLSNKQARSEMKLKSGSLEGRDKSILFDIIDKFRELGIQEDISLPQV